MSDRNQQIKEQIHRATDEVVDRLDEQLRSGGSDVWAGRNFEGHFKLDDQVQKVIVDIKISYLQD